MTSDPGCRPRIFFSSMYNFSCTEEQEIDDSKKASGHLDFCRNHRNILSALGSHSPTFSRETIKYLLQAFASVQSSTTVTV